MRSMKQTFALQCDVSLRMDFDMDVEGLGLMELRPELNHQPWSTTQNPADDLSQNRRHAALTDKRRWTLPVPPTLHGVCSRPSRARITEYRKVFVWNSPILAPRDHARRWSETTVPEKKSSETVETNQMLLSIFGRMDSAWRVAERRLEPERT